MGYLCNGVEYDGVCAHNSTKSGYDNDSYDDRLWLMESVLSRTGTVDYSAPEWTSFKELVKGSPFAVKQVTRHIRMDYDMKRKPDRSSFEPRNVRVGNRSYEIATFTTIPFDTVAEFKEYRQRKSTVSCLRTMSDWDLFWFKTDARSTNIKVRDMDWSCLNSCIMGHRAGFWTIPKLDELSGQNRCDWINAHNRSKKVFTQTDWKNAGRNSRQVNMLPRKLLSGLLDELISDQ